MAGQTTDWKLLVYGAPPSDDELASWMQDGRVSPLLIAEQGSNEPYTLLVNFSHVVAARMFPVKHGRGVSF
jgi:hypothetical protein